MCYVLLLFPYLTHTLSLSLSLICLAFFVFVFVFYTRLLSSFRSSFFVSSPLLLYIFDSLVDLFIRSTNLISFGKLTITDQSLLWQQIVSTDGSVQDQFEITK